MAFPREKPCIYVDRIFTYSRDADDAGTLELEREYVVKALTESCSFVGELLEDNKYVGDFARWHVDNLSGTKGIQEFAADDAAFQKFVDIERQVLEQAGLSEQHARSLTNKLAKFRNGFVNADPAELGLHAEKFGNTLNELKSYVCNLDGPFADKASSVSLGRIRWEAIVLAVGSLGSMFANFFYYTQMGPEGSQLSTSLGAIGASVGITNIKQVSSQLNQTRHQKQQRPPPPKKQKRRLRPMT